MYLLNFAFFSIYCIFCSNVAAIFFDCFHSEIVPQCMGRDVATRCGWSLLTGGASMQNWSRISSSQFNVAKQRNTRSQFSERSFLWVKTNENISNFTMIFTNFYRWKRKTQTKNNLKLFELKGVKKQSVYVEADRTRSCRQDIPVFGCKTCRLYLMLC